MMQQQPGYTTSGKNSQKLFYALLSLLAVVATLSLWLLRNNQQVGDSLGIAYYVKLGQDISNPHHLLYGPIVWLLHRFANVFIEIDVLAVGQAHNVAWAVVCLLSLVWLVRYYTRNTFYAVASGLVLLVSHQFWQYSTQFEVYVPALGCLALLLALLVKAGERPLSFKVQLVTVVLLFFSICYHQMGVLFLLPLAALYYLQWGRQGAWALIKIAVASGTVCMVAYVAVYLIMYSHEASLTGFMKYCVHYAYSNPDWGTFEHFTKKEEIARIFDNIAGSFLATYWATKIPLSVLVSGLGLVFAWNAFAAWRKLTGVALRITLLIWLAVYFLFLLWWTPGYEFFVMLTWPILLLVLFMVHDIAVLVKQTLLLPVAVAVVAAIGLGFVNSPSFIHYHRNHDEGYIKAQTAMELNPGNCWVITNFNIMLNLKYFHNYHSMIESDGLAIDYYFRDTVPSITQFKDMDCVLVEMWYYNPWYGPMGENGFTQPKQWLKLNQNLFRFETDTVGRLTAAAPFEVMSDGNKVPYLLVDRTQTKPINGYRAFFARMDSLVAIHGQAQDISYLKWYEEHIQLMP